MRNNTKQYNNILDYEIETKLKQEKKYWLWVSRSQYQHVWSLIQLNRYLDSI